MKIVIMLSAPEIESEILDIQEVAELYRKHRRTVDAWLKSNNPPPSFMKGRVRLFVKSKLLRWRNPDHG